MVNKCTNNKPCAQCLKAMKKDGLKYDKKKKLWYK